MLKKHTIKCLILELTYHFTSEVKILTNERKNILPPHDHKNVVGTYSIANKKHVENAIENNLKVKESWSNMHWSER